MRKGIHNVRYSKKAKKSICYHTNFNSIFNMSSYRKPEIPNDLPKSPRSIFHQNFNQESLTMLILSF